MTNKDFLPVEILMPDKEFYRLSFDGFGRRYRRMLNKVLAVFFFKFFIDNSIIGGGRI